MLDTLALPCEFCGQPFEKTAWNKRYCSKLCSSRTPNRRAKQAEGRALNRERQRSYAKRHYAANRDEYAARTKNWRAANPERAREVARNGRTRRYRSDPAADLARQHARRAATVGTFTGAEWRSIPFNDICSYCGKTGEMTIDHVVPISAGGTNSTENIVPACGRCNSSKGNKSLVFYLAQRSN